MFCFETGVCNVLQTFWKVTFITCFSGLKNSHQVGDFQVATGGGFWVATRAEEELRRLQRENEHLKEEKAILKKALAIFSKHPE